MNFYSDNEPIIACSTGNFTNTAIALIRLSGFKNLLDLQPFFDFDFRKVKPRFSHLINLVHNNIFFDNCMIVFFPEGKSFTGENILEIHVHGNKLNIDRILQLFVSNSNLRLADPGEFSFRAFKNKKLTLTQVEGLDLFLNANNALMLDQGLDILQGQLHQSYLKLYSLFLKLKSSIELLIDFSEDVGEEYAREMYFKLFDELSDLVTMLNNRTEGDLSSFINPEVVIVGETNSGKSSFFNLMLNQDRSIVSNIKGTTRDYISETISINGNNFVLIDTAGIRETFDEIEKIGISRSFDKVKNAFFKILLINPSDFSKEYLTKLSDFKFDLVLFTHSDFEKFNSNLDSFSLENLNFDYLSSCSFLSGSIGPIVKSGSIGPELKSGSIGPELKSGSIGPELKSGSIGPEIRKLVVDKYLEVASKNPILLSRHRSKIRELHNKIFKNINEYRDLSDMAISSSNINGLGLIISELVGQVSSDDVLNSVFDNFCIGK